MKKKFLITIFVFFGIVFTSQAQAQIADSLNQSVRFFVDDTYDEINRMEITATLRQIGEHAYFYVEDVYFNSLNTNERNQFLVDQDAIVTEFDQVIYPGLTAFYGSEWNPGIDGDSKVTFLLTPMQDDAGGYFRTNDEYTIQEINDSNMREMIYFNAKHIGSIRAKSLISHEFHHLINFYQKNKVHDVNEEVWLNEMRSEFSPTVLGYDNDYETSNIFYRERHFIATPGDPLVEWNNQSEDYGVVNFFSQYVADRYGRNVFSLAIRNAKRGAASLNKVFEDSGMEDTFSSVFTDWTVANIVSDCLVADGQYCYRSDNLLSLKIEPTATYDIFSPFTAVSVGGTMKDWSARWYKFNGTGLSDKALKVSFRGDNADGSFNVPYILEGKNGEKTVETLRLVDDEGIGYIKDFGEEVKSILVVPASHFTGNGDRSGSDRNKTFTLSVNVVENVDVPQVLATEEEVVTEEPVEEIIVESTELLNLPDGSLVRGIGDYKVYIIQGGFKRHLLDGRIFDFYGHLSWENIHDVNPVILGNYTESFLVRAATDKKVYEINGDKTRHWINISAEAFTASGRQWGSISIINEAERDFYILGVDVRK